MVEPGRSVARRKGQHFDELRGVDVVPDAGRVLGIGSLEQAYVVDIILFGRLRITRVNRDVGDSSDRRAGLGNGCKGQHKKQSEKTAHSKGPFESATKITDLLKHREWGLPEVGLPVEPERRRLRKNKCSQDTMVARPDEEKTTAPEQEDISKSAARDAGAVSAGEPGILAGRFARPVADAGSLGPPHPGTFQLQRRHPH